jgi:hypothetical protein
MHELLSHFEDNHVMVENSDMDDDDELPFQFENNQDIEMADSFNEFSGKRNNKSVAPSDIYQNDSMVSCFETSIIRKRQQTNPNSPPQPWRNTVESPPKMFPLVLEGPTKYVKSREPQQTQQPIDISPKPDKSPLEIPTLEIDAKNNDDSSTTDDKDERPYKCKISGCNKAYKNPGGLKYHMQHGHCEDTGDPEMNNIIHKPYQCTVLECGKRYKNLNGLKVSFY